MDQAILLYNTDEGKYPKKNGSSFRSIQIFVCWVCGSLSNNVFVATSMLGQRLVTRCPNGDKCWHHKLENKMFWMRKPHPLSYMNELSDEVSKIKRDNAGDTKNDLVGKPDMLYRKPVAVTSWKSSSIVCVCGFGS